MAKTVVQHVLKRLRELGISDIFGVPGDFAFPINDAICKDKKLRWIGSCNELNAACLLRRRLRARQGLRRRLHHLRRDLEGRIGFTIRRA